MAKSYIQGKYTPRNPDKYVGDPTSIFARSSWERKVMIFFDMNPSILAWNSECTVIPYISPLDNKVHRYFTDFSVKYKTKEGKVKKALVEVKPMSQVLPPEKKSKTTKRFITEVSTFAVNQAKWSAAKEWCVLHGYEWMVLTEKDLGL